MNSGKHYPTRLMLSLLGLIKRTSLSKLSITFVLPQLLYLFLSVTTDAMTLINVLNVVQIALSIGVCVAYFPNAFSTLTSPWPLYKADVLIMGVFLSWFASAFFGTYSVVWRLLGQPLWFANSDFNSYAKYCYCCAAVCHLVGSGSIGGAKVPHESYVRTGIIVAGSILAGVALATFLNYWALSDIPLRILFA